MARPAVLLRQPSHGPRRLNRQLSWCVSNRRTIAEAGLLVVLLAASVICGTPRAYLAISVADAQVPPGIALFRFTHVFIVVEDNHGYHEVIGNGEMPYFNGLAQTYGLATNYFANTHPSVGNYFMLTTGRRITRNDGFSGTVAVNNVVRIFARNNISWKAYV
jgi:hypothetical protein